MTGMACTAAFYAEPFGSTGDRLRAREPARWHAAITLRKLFFMLFRVVRALNSIPAAIPLPEGQPIRELSPGSYDLPLNRSSTATYRHAALAAVGRSAQRSGARSRSRPRLGLINGRERSGRQRQKEKARAARQVADEQQAAVGWRRAGYT